MTDSAPSSPSIVSSNLGIVSASDFDSRSETASLSDSDFEVVLVTQATATLTISDSDSGSLISAPTDFIDSDDEHIIIPNISQSLPNTPRPSRIAPAPARLTTPRPASVAVARPIVESGHDSDASDREDSSACSSYDSDSDGDNVKAPIASTSTSTLMAHPNASAATIRPTGLPLPAPRRLSRIASMHAPAITTNTIMGITSSAPLSPPTPSDGGEIPYAPFTAAPMAVAIPVHRRTPPIAPTSSAPAAVSVPAPIAPSPVSKSSPPPIPGGIVGRKKWSHMNFARLNLGFQPLKHILRLKQNCEVAQKVAVEKGTPRAQAEAAARVRAQEEAEARARAHTEAMAREKAQAQAAKRAKAEARAKVEAEAKAAKAAKAKLNAPAKAKGGGNKPKQLVAPRPTVGASPTTSEDEAPPARASMFSPVNDISVQGDSPDDEDAYDAAIKQLDDHLLSPPEHPTATYRHLLNQALLLEFRIGTSETLPKSHGATIAMVKANVHINVLDYVGKRKEGFGSLRAAMLANAKALRKDVRKRKMPVKAIKSLGLHSLLAP